MADRGERPSEIVLRKTEHGFDHVAAAEQLNRRHQERGSFFCDLSSAQDKFYSLGMFPYPSGNAHMGHVLVYSLTDVVARYAKLCGKNTLNPIGWDAFGLPAENAAIKAGADPAAWTKLNIERMKQEQFRDMGWAFDLTKELTTSDPLYYANTQRLFLLMFSRGLAYQKEGLVNWDPVDKTVLADEQVIDGKSWRSGAPIEKKWMRQWFFRVSGYCERLWEDISLLTKWPNSAVAVQKNWINRSEGTDVKFKGDSFEVDVYTTRVDTLFGVTALVVAPEHPLARKLHAENGSPIISSYVESALKRSAVDRVSQERTGVDTGLICTHPFLNREIPVWIGDYVLGDVGTGAVMCVPAHDERDYDFAVRHSLPVIKVVQSIDGSEALPQVNDGILINSGQFSGLTSQDARGRIADALIERGVGRRSVRYNLRDWSVGRQRFWGCPIPIIHCGECGPQPVPADQLPVLLPTEIPLVDGRRQLSTHAEFTDVPCPCCGQPAKRETDTLDTFVCSSWYPYKFLDAQNGDRMFDSDTASNWMPIDFYVGGLEHAAQHMIYLRYITKVLHDAGLVSHSEPVTEFYCNGIIKKDGAKMSKSRGNVVVPTEIIAKYGGDALRLYVLSDTPADIDREWNDAGIEAKRSFIERTYRAIDQFLQKNQVENDHEANLSCIESRFVSDFYSLIARYGKNIEGRHFNGAVANIRELTSLLCSELTPAKHRSHPEVIALQKMIRDYLVVTSIFMPYMTETLLLAHYPGSASIFNEKWPTVDESLVAQTSIPIVVQFNGKKKAVVTVPKGAGEDEVADAIMHDEALGSRLKEVALRKRVFVPDKLINFVF